MKQNIYNKKWQHNACMVSMLKKKNDNLLSLVKKKNAEIADLKYDSKGKDQLLKILCAMLLGISQKPKTIINREAVKRNIDKNFLFYIENENYVIEREKK